MKDTSAGEINWFSNDGYGFITHENTPTDFFFHITDSPSTVYDSQLIKGRVVEFKYKRTNEGLAVTDIDFRATDATTEIQTLRSQ